MASATFEVTANALAMLPAKVRRRAKDYAGFTLDWNPVLASSTQATPQRAFFTIPDDVDFVATMVTGVGLVSPAGAIVIPSVTPFLQFFLNDRAVFADVATHFNMFANGTAQAPLPLPFPLFMPRRSVLTGYATAQIVVDIIMRITFHGFVLHHWERSNLQPVGF